MCGIIGYTGKKNALKPLINGLKRLEYRGYDSAGIAILRHNTVAFSKKSGKLHVLTDELKRLPIEGNTGVGHVRWATHGIPNEINAHPHLDSEGKIAVVHNGIIENHQSLKQELIKEGYNFVSDTDTEVIPNLIAKYYKGNLLEAVRRAVNLLKGSYAICCVHMSEPGKIIGARRDSPLIVGVGEGQNFFASDVPAILDYTKNVIFLENAQIAEITADSVRVIDRSGEGFPKKISRIKWDIKQAEKGGFKHFMLKEIFEQDQVAAKILKERVKKSGICFEELALSGKVFKNIKDIAIVACGTAFHAALVGKYMLEKVARIPVWVDTSSEFRYRNPLVGKGTLAIVVSQSGETADTLAALREAKKRGARTLAICNVLSSSIDRESDGVIYTHAGPEIAVASTKAYTAQLAILYLLTIYIGQKKGTISGKLKNKLLRELKKVPRLMQTVLNEFSDDKNKIAKYAKAFRKYYLKMQHKSTFLYLARNINYPNALEGALKLKEISYISAEGYPAGEMKHGPIALIDENPWVVCIATRSRVYEKMLTNIQEVKARGGIIIAIATEGDKEIANQNINYIIEVPKIDEFFSPMLVAIPLQLLAYYVAREFGYDIDQPRNLAKSVTVE
jgi:glucosamine--fructose-6-phosphate aminotransferase (isomerizing)